MSESSATHPPGEQHACHASRKFFFCPRCESPKTQTKNCAKKLCGAFGTCVDVASTLSSATKGAAIGVVIGLRVTAPTTPLSSVTAAVLGALAGGAIGCASGAALGQVIDDTVLNNHLCLHCGHSFPTQ
tara:strand:+ start:10514 stop:10900 length:387 start_codon:yes stop_codon:yes gene_type:complete